MFMRSFIILMIFFVSRPSWAVDSYIIANGATTTIDEFSVCWKVTNNTGTGIMVPTKTAAEWSTGASSFVSNVGNYSTVTLAACAVSCGAGQYLSGTCVDVGAGYYSAAGINTRTACPSNRYTAGTGTGADSNADCLAGDGYYGTTTSTNAYTVGVNYYSAYRSNTRTACPSRRKTTGSGTGANANADCLAEGGYYGSNTTTAAIAVGSSYHSPYRDNTRVACPSNRYTTGTGTGADSNLDCLAGSGYYGTNTATNATWVGNTYYSAYRDNTRTACNTGARSTSPQASLSDCKPQVRYYLTTGTTHPNPTCSNVSQSNITADVATYKIFGCVTGAGTTSKACVQVGSSCVIYSSNPAAYGTIPNGAWTSLGNGSYVSSDLTAIFNTNATFYSRAYNATTGVTSDSTYMNVIGN